MNPQDFLTDAEKAILEEDDPAAHRTERWEAAQKAFRDSHPDFRGKIALSHAFAGVVNHLIQTGQDKDLSDEDLLKTAWNQTRDDFGLEPEEPADVDFDALDALEGQAYEDAVGRLSPGQLAAYEGREE